MNNHIKAELGIQFVIYIQTHIWIDLHSILNFISIIGG